MSHHRQTVSAAPTVSALTAAAASPFATETASARATTGSATTGTPPAKPTRARTRRRVPAIASALAAAIAIGAIGGTVLLSPVMPTLQASPLQAAQAAAPQSTAPPAAPVRQPARPRPNKVFLSGENPWIDLHDTPDGPTVTEVSFWRIHWSPVGTGHVCFVILGEEQAPDTVRVALYDNRQLLDYLTRDVLGSYNKAYIDRPFTPVGDATFSRQGDARTTHRETCKAKGYDIELSWHAPREPGLIDILPGSRPTNPFGITYLRIPVERAEVRVNGKPARGRSLPGGSFLAFGETWIK